MDALVIAGLLAFLPADVPTSCCGKLDCREVSVSLRRTQDADIVHVDGARMVLQRGRVLRSKEAMRGLYCTNPRGTDGKPCSMDVPEERCARCVVAPSPFISADEIQIHRRGKRYLLIENAPCASCHPQTY
jgi:hypothetical protein